MKDCPPISHTFTNSIESKVSLCSNQLIKVQTFHKHIHYAVTFYNI